MRGEQTKQHTALWIYKVFLHFARCILCVKATTSNATVFGETEHLPPKPVVHDISINICKQIVSYVSR